MVSRDFPGTGNIVDTIYVGSYHNSEEAPSKTVPVLVRSNLHLLSALPVHDAGNPQSDQNPATMNAVDASEHYESSAANGPSSTGPAPPKLLLLTSLTPQNRLLHSSL